jgi:tetratricopeptide (TPR) repeat protein
MNNSFARFIALAVVGPVLLACSSPVAAQGDSDPATPLACALKLARTLDPEKNSGTRNENMQRIAALYWRAGDHNTAQDVYGEMGCGGRQFMYSYLADEAMRTGQREFLLKLIESTVRCAENDDFYQKNWVFTKIVRDLIALHRPRKALEIAQLIEDETSYKASAFAAVADAFIKAGERERAVGLLDRAMANAKAVEEEDSDRSCEAAIEIADVYDRVGDLEKSTSAQSFAFKLASESRNDKSGLNTLLAMRFAKQGNWSECARLLSSISKNDRPRSLIRVATVYASQSQKAKAKELLNKVSGLIASDVELDSSNYLKSTLVDCYLSLGEPALALASIRGMKTNYAILGSTIALSDWYIKHKNTALAVELLELASLRFQSIHSESREEILPMMSSSQAKEKASYLSQIADKFIQLGRFDKAKVAIDAIDLPQARAEKLGDLAGAMIVASQHHRALSVLAQALTLSYTAEHYPHDRFRELALANIAQRYAEVGEREQSVLLFKRILDFERDLDDNLSGFDQLETVGFYYERSGLGPDPRITASLRKIIEDWAED